MLYIKVNSNLVLQSPDMVGHSGTLFDYVKANNRAVINWNGKDYESDIYLIDDTHICFSFLYNELPDSYTIYSPVGKSNQFIRPPFYQYIISGCWYYESLTNKAFYTKTLINPDEFRTTISLNTLTLDTWYSSGDNYDILKAIYDNPENYILTYKFTEGVATTIQIKPVEGNYSTVYESYGTIYYKAFGFTTVYGVSAGITSPDKLVQDSGCIVIGVSPTKGYKLSVIKEV